jgi:hypothetical protein
LVCSDVTDQASDRVRCTAELFGQGPALGVTTLNAELVALWVGQNRPSAAVWPALVVDHPGADAEGQVDHLVAPAPERHEIKM